MAQGTRKFRVSQKTREQLILAAERLFGEAGIDAVSLRQINVAAGQRNSSAAHYHFGSKDSLIMAMYDYRMERVNRRRIEMLEKIGDGGDSDDIRAIIETIVYPIVEEVEQSEGGRHYIRFMAQGMGHPRVDLFALWRSKHGEGLMRIITLLRTALPDLPEPLLGQRFGLTLQQTVHALADREILLAGIANDDQINPSLFVSNLVDSCAGAITAPISETTQLELKRSAKRKRNA